MGYFSSAAKLLKSLRNVLLYKNFLTNFLTKISVIRCKFQRLEESKTYSINIRRRASRILGRQTSSGRSVFVFRGPLSTVPHVGVMFVCLIRSSLHVSLSLAG